MFPDSHTTRKLALVAILCLVFGITNRQPRKVATEMETTQSGHFRWIFTLADGTREILDSNDHAKPFDITLPDGSRVKLSFGSSLRYPAVFDSRIRSVILNGEAAFDIANSARAPFIVHTDSASILVLGTFFDIQAYDSQPMEITLISGSLRVNEGADTERLQPAEQAVRDNGRFQVHSLDDPRKYLSWSDQAPYVHFENKDLGAVVRYLARWYRFKVANPDHIRGVLVSGDFPLGVPPDVNLKFVNDAEKHAARVSRNGNTFFIGSFH